MADRSMDLTMKLRELRRLRGWTQPELARKSGVGLKTLSSFETGSRILSMKVSQLVRILDACGVTPVQFFGNYVERHVPEWEIDPNSDNGPTPLQLLFVAITELPDAERARAIDACNLIVRLSATNRRRVA